LARTSPVTHSPPDHRLRPRSRTRPRKALCRASSRACSARQHRRRRLHRQRPHRRTLMNTPNRPRLPWAARPPDRGSLRRFSERSRPERHQARAKIRLCHPRYRSPFPSHARQCRPRKRPHRLDRRRYRARSLANSRAYSDRPPCRVRRRPLSSLSRQGPLPRPRRRDPANSRACSDPQRAALKLRAHRSEIVCAGRPLRKPTITCLGSEAHPHRVRHHTSHRQVRQQLRIRENHRIRGTWICRGRPNRLASPSSHALSRRIRAPMPLSSLRVSPSRRR